MFKKCPLICRIVLHSSCLFQTVCTIYNANNALLPLSEVINKKGATLNAFNFLQHVYSNVLSARFFPELYNSDSGQVLKAYWDLGVEF